MQWINNFLVSRKNETKTQIKRSKIKLLYLLAPSLFLLNRAKLIEYVTEISLQYDERHQNTDLKRLKLSKNAAAYRVQAAANQWRNSYELYPVRAGAPGQSGFQGHPEPSCPEAFFISA
jgi:hypothetical protein